MDERTHGASRIQTLRLAIGPGASAITQLAAALMRRADTAGSISVAGFLFPYAAGVPALVCPGRKALAPAYVRRTSCR